MKKYITSDIHFYHKNIMKFCPESRGHFTDVNHMNEMIIKMWNEDVEDDESIVYILGDVSFGRVDDTVAILRRMKGKKILIRGNHDTKMLTETRFRACFESIHDYLEVKEDGNHFVMFHFPIWEWHRIHHGAIHFHGHLHGGKTDIPGRILDVGVDGNQCRVYDMDRLTKKMLQMPIRTHHNIDTSTPEGQFR